MLRFAIALCLIVLPLVQPAFAQAGPDRIVVAQDNKPRTLFDLLFGGDDDEPKQQAPTRRSAPAPQASLPPPVPEVEKAEDATRLAVFGDSLAVDLAKALERAYAEDPNLVVIEQGVGSSGFVRDDYFDWNAALADAIAENIFDIAVVIIGINDRQPIGDFKPLSDAWKERYSERLSRFLAQLRAAGKPAVWVGLPPMQAPSYSAAMTQISSIHKMAAFSGGAEYVDIYERFADEDGNYTAYGPDLNGQNAQMRKGDGIHFAAAGANKLAFYVTQALKTFYRGGTVSVEVADLLAGTDAAGLQRPPYQGLGQIRLLEVAGAVMPLSGEAAKASDLLVATPDLEGGRGFDLESMVMAPAGRADSFGVGVVPEEPEAAEAAAPR